ncbi:RNA polymerase sigma24 factor [Actinorhabdospora filicis]|uniref:RNA polymerase sigma24 factor n=1 Tax=Actinorhabdospora filicis TaxID=1785913 RepID=A0A9W6SK50_9ACTN|nr:SigE family RNA polymerase sigma factor [Actinorhabdospora filicis]GLZ77427.1 RNA polymerase sigma24 factor [Actinorhabdospora filicis]
MTDKDTEFAQFVTERAARLRGFAYLLCGDWHRAEDVVQTALLKLYRAWGRVRTGAPDAYVRRIIATVLVDQHRLAWFRRVKVTADHSLPEEVAVDERADQRLTLTRALLRLPKRQRAAIVLRYWEDLPVEQTARVLGCSTGAVKNLTMRGLTTLRGLVTDPVLESIEG